jgi:hypothetical protein
MMVRRPIYLPHGLSEGGHRQLPMWNSLVVQIRESALA